MGHIVKSEKDIGYFCDLIYEINEISLDKEMIESILDRILPKDENNNLIIQYKVKEKGRITAMFIPNSEIVEISVKKLKEWLEINSDDLAEMFGIENKSLLKNYLVLMVLMHETEHVYQYLIAKGIIEAPCKFVQEGYKTLFDMLTPKDYIIPRPIKQVRRFISVVSYKLRENEFLLERNAQLDSLSTLANIAFENKHNDIREAIMKMKNIFATAGYNKNNNGPLVNTFYSIFMGDRLKKMNHDYDSIDMIERYRLGLPVDDETRERILALRK